MDDCPTSACAGDETCLNLKGNPYACVYSQVLSQASQAKAWADFLATRNSTELGSIIAPNGGVVILSFSVLLFPLPKSN